MLGVVFLFSQFSPIEILFFKKNFLYPIIDIDCLSSNVKKIFYLQFLFVKFWRFENCQIGNVLD